MEMTNAVLQNAVAQQPAPPGQPVQEGMPQQFVQQQPGQPQQFVQQQPGQPQQFVQQQPGQPQQFVQQQPGQPQQFVQQQPGQPQQFVQQQPGQPQEFVQQQPGQPQQFVQQQPGQPQQFAPEQPQQQPGQPQQFVQQQPGQPQQFAPEQPQQQPGQPQQMVPQQFQQQPGQPQQFAPDQFQQQPGQPQQFAPEQFQQQPGQPQQFYPQPMAQNMGGEQFAQYTQYLPLEADQRGVQMTALEMGLLAEGEDYPPIALPLNLSVIPGEGGEGDEYPPIPEEPEKPPNHRIIEQTLGIVKPDAVNKAEEIINLLRREGLQVLQTRRVQLTPEQAATFYQDQYQEEWFSGAVTNLSSGPCLAMIICGPAAIRHWLELMGPASWADRAELTTTLRYMYGVCESDYDNALHGSENETEALRELHFFFPEVIVEPILQDNLASLYLNQFVHPVLTIGLSKLVREKPDDPVMWLADWLLANNPNKPKETNTGKDFCM